MQGRITIGEHTILVPIEDGSVVVTRPTVMGGVATHTIKSPYTVQDLADYLYKKINGLPTPMVQDRFSQMSKEDREFLLTGITPTEWDEMFKEED